MHRHAWRGSRPEISLVVFKDEVAWGGWAVGIIKTWGVEISVPYIKCHVHQFYRSSHSMMILLEVEFVTEDASGTTSSTSQTSMHRFSTSKSYPAFSPFLLSVHIYICLDAFVLILRLEFLGAGHLNYCLLVRVCSVWVYTRHVGSSFALRVFLFYHKSCLALRRQSLWLSHRPSEHPRSGRREMTVRKLLQIEKPEWLLAGRYFTYSFCCF
jgi:hypothetical protein